MTYTDDFSGIQSYILILYQECKIFINGIKVILQAMYHSCEDLNKILKFMFVWYDTAYLSKNGENICVLWYDIVYLSETYAKFSVFMVRYGILSQKWCNIFILMV